MSATGCTCPLEYAYYGTWKRHRPECPTNATTATIPLYGDRLGPELTAALAEIERLRADLDRGRAAIFAHHDMANLSEAAIRESIGGTCRIFARALATIAPQEPKP